jgi:hypothetical protein
MASPIQGEVSGKNATQLLSDAFGLFSTNAQPLLLLGLGSALVSAIAAIVTIPSDLIESVALDLLSALLTLLLTFTLGLYLEGAMVLAVSEARAGARVDAGQALSRTAVIFKDLFWACLRSAAIVVGLAITVLGIPWAIMRAVKWCLIIQAVVLGGSNRENALDASARLVGGRGWWRVFWTLAAFGLLIGIPILLVSLVARAIGGALAASLLQLVIAPITAATRQETGRLLILIPEFCCCG